MVLGFTTQAVTEPQIRRLLDLVVRENTALFLGQLRAGQQVQSAADAELRYCPDRASPHEIVILDAASLLDQGVGSCGSIAAYEVAYLRAIAQHQGTPAPVAAGRYAPELRRQPTRNDVAYWHAIVRTPSGLYDPTRHLPQVCVTPSYA